MKIQNLLGACIIILLYSCNSKNNKHEPKIIYQAIHNQDTATLKLTFTGKTFYGQLETNYHNAYTDSGGVTGIVEGDTLLKGTYRFQHYGIKKYHTRPIALLKKKDKLVMGEGPMEIFMGMYYFKKYAPINYQDAKFIFEKKQ